MGKHSQNKKYKKNKKKIKISIYILLVIIILVISLVCAFQKQIRELLFKEKDIYMENEKTIENEQLMIRSTADYNTIVKFKFENNILSSMIIYEQYENKENFLKEQENIRELEEFNMIDIVNINEKELSIEFQKKDLGEDKNKSYEEIYDKYINQLIGMYEIISC